MQLSELGARMNHSIRLSTIITIDGGPRVVRPPCHVFIIAKPLWIMNTEWDDRGIFINNIELQLNNSKFYFTTYRELKVSDIGE